MTTSRRCPRASRTLVGPKGVRLSGGQIQRTAAARAFVRRPELLVVDDLSSALDVTTEARLWDGLFDNAGADLTILAVSHRARVLERADQVIQLESGRPHQLPPARPLPRGGHSLSSAGSTWSARTDRVPFVLHGETFAPCA